MSVEAAPESVDGPPTDEAGPPEPPARRAAAWRVEAVGGVAWAAALVAALLVGEVPPWRGAAAFLIGLALLPAWPGAPLRVVVAVGAAAPLVLPAVAPDHAAEANPAALVLLCVAAAAGGWWRAGGVWRQYVAAAALLVGLLSSMQQWATVPGFGELSGAAYGLLPVGVVIAGLTLATPATRGAGATLIGAAALCLVQGMALERAAGTLPLAAAGWRVADHEAGRLWPLVELRATGHLPPTRPGDLASALEVVRAAPHRARVGSAVVRTVGAELPLRVGWDPRLPLDPAVAFEVAVAAHELGLADIAVRAFAQAELPADIAPAPGVVLTEPAVRDADAVALFRADAVETLVIEAIGVPRDGIDALLTVTVGGRTWGPTVIPAAGGAWLWEVNLGPGIYRVRARLTNPDGGGRRLTDLRIEAR